MDIRALKLFVEVVRHGGFSRAVPAAHATQSTLSKAVKQLEDEVGLPLLERLPQGVRLTSAGAVLHRRALAILAQVEDAGAEIDEVKGLRRGTLRLGVPLVGADTLFAKPLAEYRQRHPGIEIQLTEQGSKDLERKVLDGELELAASLLPAPEAFAWQEILREPIDLLVPAEDPLAGKARATFRDLADHPIILYPQGFALNPRILDAFRENRIQPRIAAQTSQTGLIIGLVAARLGVAFLPRMLAMRSPDPRTRRLPIDGPALFWHMALIWRREAYLSPEARAWIALMGPRAASGKPRE
ncbi:LysR family transcriptional regulator [Mesoterricola sediminis]|uniref:Transcriptional regulator n=1 Tax=Mesoterricola sediminis TaxID=2927980 RepID=A0AA48KGV2_9BACT|nr:LysR family transcriptional regulator [Mesoterricola sediminis]BDU77768.1 transcriptional regulator [Mesoterricola sediminis]